jgi:hypothetical protein
MSKYNIFAASCMILILVTASRADTVNYSFVENYNMPTLDRGGVTVSGSANVTLGEFAGLGIATGFSQRVDGVNNNQEWVEFAFNAGSATGVSWTTGSASDGNDPGFVLGDATVEAWDEDGTYLGSGSTSAGSLIKELDIYFGFGQEYSRFRLTSALGDSFDIRSVTFTPIPEPAGAALFLLGSVLLLSRRSRGARE